MSHFVSESCLGELCASENCGREASHKIGEEIPHDEPCARCGGAWRHDDDDEDAPQIPPPDRACPDAYHWFDGVPRHNLTAYVCCDCFCALFGDAECP